MSATGLADRIMDNYLRMNNFVDRELSSRLLDNSVIKLLMKGDRSSWRRFKVGDRQLGSNLLPNWRAHTTRSLADYSSGEILHDSLGGLTPAEFRIQT